MDFLSGAILWGGLAAAIPVILHLTGRAKPILHKFPAMRFLLASQRASTRALRLKHVLLLALRILAILLLVLALARPKWPLPALASDLIGRVHGEFVLVLDASLSMQYRERDTMRFEQARQEALQFLERLAPEARVALILATEDAENLQGRVTLNHEHVRDLVVAAKPTARGFDLHRALTSARSILDREPATDLPRAVLLFTDLQRNAFQALQTRGPGIHTNETRLPALFIVDAGSEGAINGAALAVRLPGSTLPAETPLTLTARIRPVDPQRACPVDLIIDGVKVGQRALDPRGATELEAEFTLPPCAPGPHSGRLQVAQNDALPQDQERFIAFQAGRPPRVLLVERPDRTAGTPGGASGRGSGFFLRAALDSPSARALGGHALAVEPSATLNAAKLAQHQAVLLADPGELNEESWAALSTFVAEGGGLWVWIGPHTPMAALRKWSFSEFSAHRGLLPGTPAGMLQSEAERSWFIKVALPGHPLLAHFTPGVLSELNSVKITSHLKVIPEPKDADCAVILNLSSGAPLLMEKPYGRGRVLLTTIAPDLEGNDLARHGEVFLTMILEGCRMLTGRGEELEARLGHTLNLSIPQPPADGMVSWLAPGAKVATPLQLEPEPSSGTDTGRPGNLLVPDFETPGIHRFTWKPGKGEGSRVLLVAANPEPSESDLARVSAEEAGAILQPWKTTLVKGVDQMPGLEAGKSAGRELPALMLLLVLLCLVVESFFSNRLYRNEPAN